jgi:hypothetical protein
VRITGFDKGANRKHQNLKEVTLMLNSTITVIKHKIGLLNLAEELGNVSKACKILPDQQWIETGLLRVLSQEISGRSFLQKLFDSGRIFLDQSLFFEALKMQKAIKIMSRSKLCSV